LATKGAHNVARYRSMSAPMADASIALNRFGLGARADESPPTAPREWLLGQLKAFDPKPQMIATLPATRVIAAELGDYLEELRAARAQAGGERPGLLARMRGAQASPGAEQMRPVAAAPDSATMQSGAAGGDAMPDMMRDPVAQIRAFARKQGRDYYATAVTARAEAALVTPAPFVERLVHFWSNHFAVSIDKFQIVGLAGAFEFDAIRPHVLGNFRDMLFAVERHPAMLLYLDQAQSVGPDSTLGSRGNRTGRQLGLNENLAREILELHTLGVRTGYSLADVTEFARALTGWTVAGLSRGVRARVIGNEGDPGAFIFADRLHEPGARTILGKRYPAGGLEQASAVLDDLVRHPATAHHIATKLSRHFAGDDPPPTMVARVEAAFVKSSGDLPTLYRAIVESPECWAADSVKFKTPWEWSVSAMRAVGARDLAQPLVTVGLLNQLGQPIWRPGSPAGFDDIAASWAGPDAVLRRVEAAQRIAARTRDTLDARIRAPQLFPGALSAATAEQIARAESPGQGVALMLVAPEFMRR
jgi:uncharacterized protein (DUF1800 family)